MCRCYWTDCILQLRYLIPGTTVTLCRTTLLSMLSMLQPCTHEFSPPNGTKLSMLEPHMSWTLTAFSCTDNNNMILICCLAYLM